jgi:hypothetical protein
MLTEIPRDKWKLFCDELSRDRIHWETSVEILSSQSGAQVLSAGLPLIGLTFDIEDGKEKIELVTGTGASIHQTHSIFDPCKLILEAASDRDGGILDIEDDEGTKTLISFIRPAYTPATYERGDLVSSH